MSNSSYSSSVISSHTRQSAKGSSIHPLSANNQGYGGYGQAAKHDHEKEEDDLMKKYMEQQDKHRQLMSQNQKRRKEQEKKLKDEIEKKRKHDEEELLKRKETKQQAYMKFLRNNAAKVGDNLKQNVVYGSNPNHGQPSRNTKPTQNSVPQGIQKKQSTSNTMQNDKNKETIEDKQKPKKQWAKSKEKIDEQDKQTQQDYSKNQRRNNNLDALDLNVENNFDKIKKMYAKQKEETNGNEFIVNFEKEWRDEEESMEGMKQSMLLESLDLSTVIKKKVGTNNINNNKLDKGQEDSKRQLQNKITFTKPSQPSEFANIQENESGEDEEEQQQQQKQQPRKQQEQIKSLKTNDQQIKTKELGGKSKKMQKMIQNNDSALVREAIGFKIEDTESDDGKDFGLSKKQQQVTKKEQIKGKENEIETKKVGLTEDMLRQHNNKTKLVQEDEQNKQYDVLSWANSHQKEVDDVFSRMSSKPVSASNQNAKQRKSQQQEKQLLQQQQVTSKIPSTAPEKQKRIRSFGSEEPKEKNIETTSVSQRAQSKGRKNDNSQEKLSEVAKKSEISKISVPTQMPIPPSKQKYSNLQQQKLVSRCKSKLQGDVEKGRKANRNNLSHSPDSVGSIDEDINVEEFMRDDLVNINKEESDLQRDIYQLHFDNVERIREIQSRNNINLNLVSSKQITQLQNNPSTIAKPIKPLYECNEEELEQSLQRLDYVLARKQQPSNQINNNPQQQYIQNQLPQGYPQQFNQQQQLQQQQQIPQFSSPSYPLPVNYPQQGYPYPNPQQQSAPSNLITQQLQFLQQQQQLLLQQQQNMIAAQGQIVPQMSLPVQSIQSGSTPLGLLNTKQETTPSQIQNSKKFQQILSTTELTVQNLQEQNNSLKKLEQNYGYTQEKSIISQQNYPGQSKKEAQLNNNIKNISNSISSAAASQRQDPYNYDVFDLKSVSQMSKDTNNNLEQRRKKLKEQLDEEVESELGVEVNNIRGQQQTQKASYGKQYTKKTLAKIEDKKKSKKNNNNNEQVEETLNENGDSDGVLKFNPKLKALLLGGVEEDNQESQEEDNKSRDEEHDSLE